MAKHIPHLFLNSTELNTGKLATENFNHLIRVLKLKIADLFIGMDNSGNRFACKITEITKNTAGFIINKQEHFEKPKNKIILAQAVTKIETFETIIDQATQLGVSEIVPLITKNTTVSLDLFKKKYERFNKIIKTASEQSQRIYLPLLKELSSLDKFFNGYSNDLIIIAYEKAEKPLKECINKLQQPEIILVCGPEGGFTEAEATLFNQKNIALFSLGKNILRAETAVTVALGNILYELADLSGNHFS